MKVVVVAEYYPRRHDPVLGVWAHRQALAAREAGAEVAVVVLHRPVPPRAAIAQREARAVVAPFRQPRRATLDGLEVRYLHYVSPPRWRAYGSWGAWAAPLLRRELGQLRRRGFAFDLVHAHYAAPAGDAVRRAVPAAPLVVSVHGGDVLSVAERSSQGRDAVTATFAHARLVLANSQGTERRCRQLGASRTRVVHLGTDLPAHVQLRSPDPPRVVTVGHLVARKRHADVARALWLLRDAHPELHWTVVGDGPERRPLEELTRQLGIASRVTFTGQLPPAQALEHAQRATAIALPSVDEAFGVAYVEAMAGGVPALGSRGEDGPEAIAREGGGMVLVPPGDPEALASELRTLLEDPEYRAELGARARRTVERRFTWERCGRETVAAYEAALDASSSAAEATEATEATIGDGERVARP